MRLKIKKMPQAVRDGSLIHINEFSYLVGSYLIAATVRRLDHQTNAPTAVNVARTTV